MTNDFRAYQALQAELAALRDDVGPTWLKEPLSIEETADRYVRPALVAKRPGDLEAVEPGESEVAEDEIGRVILGHGDAFEARVGEPNPVAFGFQDPDSTPPASSPSAATPAPKTWTRP